jgi:hypothetical protein
MALFYKGVGVGTFLHVNDPRRTGMPPRAPAMAYNVGVAMRHIVHGATVSPCVSLTRSYGVAEMYAREASLTFPSASSPAYVYEVDIPDSVPAGITLIDPVKEVAATLPSPVTALSYFHDGDKNFILGVASPTLMATHLTAPIRQPPGSGGASRSANLTLELETLVRALRDAEVLVLGTIPSALVRARYAIV